MLYMTASKNSYTVSLYRNQLARSAAQAKSPCEEFVMPQCNTLYVVDTLEKILQQLHSSLLMLSMLVCCLHADPPQGWLSRSMAFLGMCINTYCICKLQLATCHFQFTHIMAYAPVRGIRKSSTAGFCPGTIRLNGCLLSWHFACKQTSSS